MFKKMREKKGLTVDFVAKKLGISKSALYKFEQNQLLPSANILLELRKLYGCTYEEIFSAYELARECLNERRIKKSS